MKVITTIMGDTTVRRNQFKKKRDNYARKLKRKKLINYLRSELLACSTPGLPYIVNAEIHCFERFFWAVSYAMCLFLVYTLITIQYTRYVNAPLVNSVEMDYFKWNVSYPAVTLCPKDKIDEDYLETIANETFETSGADLTDNLRIISSMTLDNIDTFVLTTDGATEKLIETGDYVEMANVMFKKFTNDSMTTNTNWPLSVVSTMTEMGMCHVINSNVAIFDDPTTWKDRETHKYVKTNLDLSVHDIHFFMQLHDYAKEYKIFIHSPDEIILVGSPVYNIISEGFKSFSVKVWSTRASERLRHIPISLRNCRFLNEPTNERYPVYSYNHCLLDCRIQMMLKLCRCVPHIYNVFSHERICELHELKCIVKYKTELIKLSTAITTWNRFPNKKGLPLSPRDCGCLNNCETDVYLKDLESFREGDSRIRIGISSFPKVRVVREIIFSTHDIILRSGGVLNLCIGTSIISLMELLVIAIKLIGFKIAREIVPRVYTKLGWYNTSKGTKQR